MSTITEPNLETATTTIELTISTMAKETLARLAMAEGLSLNDYIVALLLETTKETPPEPEQIVLSERDWEIFANALENPPPANEALRKAIREHQEKYGKW